jgi:hypothetical protein
MEERRSAARAARKRETRGLKLEARDGSASNFFCGLSADGVSVPCIFSTRTRIPAVNLRGGDGVEGLQELLLKI